MTEKRANEIFQTKYPNGYILGKTTGHQDQTRYWVVFDKTVKHHKAYTYCATSYGDILSRFGFTILYKHDVENIKDHINKLQAEIDAGHRIPEYRLSKPFSESDIEDRKNEIIRLTNILEIGICA